MQLKQRIVDTIDNIKETYSELETHLNEARELLSLLNENVVDFDLYNMNEVIDGLAVHLSLLVNYEIVENMLKAPDTHSWVDKKI